MAKSTAGPGRGAGAVPPTGRSTASAKVKEAETLAEIDSRETGDVSLIEPGKKKPGLVGLYRGW